MSQPEKAPAGQMDRVEVAIRDGEGDSAFCGFLALGSRDSDLLGVLCVRKKRHETLTGV